jgi:hypothetical protein
VYQHLEHAYNSNEMNRGAVLFYYITSILFLVFIAVFAGYRVKATADANLEASRKALESLRVSALSIYLAEGGFESDYFRSAMKQKFLDTPRAQLLVIRSTQEGLLFALARSDRYLDFSAALQLTQPEYSFNHLLEAQLTLPFSPGMQRNLYLDSLFAVLEAQDLYPIARELLYILLVFLAVTAVVLLVAATTGRRRAPVVENAGEWERYTPEEPPRGSSGAATAVSPGNERQREPPRERRLAPPGGGRSAARTSAERPGLFPSDTGLGPKEQLSQRLGAELDRSASFDQDLTLALIGLRAEGGASAQNLHQLGRLAREHFPFKDLAFEYDPETVAVILPDTGLDPALRDMKSFLVRVQHGPWARARSPRMAMGLSARNGRLISPARLLLEASQALKRAAEAGDNQIIAFRADPDKFRSRMLSRPRSGS